MSKGVLSVARSYTKQGLAAFILIATLSYTVAASAMPLPSSGNLLFKSDSDPVALNNDVRSDVTGRLEEIATSCSYQQASRQDWKEKIFAPYGFQVRYEIPKEMSLHTYKGDEAWQVIEIMLPLEDDPAGSGIFIKTTDQKWTYLFKCDGKKLVDLVCKPELQKFYPAEGTLYQVACQNRTKEDEQRNASNNSVLPTDAAPDTAPASGTEICEPTEKMAGAARLLIPKALERIMTGPEMDPAVRGVNEEAGAPLVVPQKGSAFEVQGDEMIFQ